MLLVMNISNVTALAISISTAVASIAAVLFALKRNTSDLDSKNIDSLKTRIGLVEAEKEDTKKRLLICEGLHRENLEKQGHMQGVITTLERVLQDRNPETTKFMEYLTKVAERSEAYMKKSDDRDEQTLAGLTAISTFMEKISTHVEPKKS